MHYSDLSNISPSVTLAINSKAKQMMSEGIDVVNLAAGVPVVEIDPEIGEYAKKAIIDDKIHYENVAGNKDLISKFNNFYNTTYSSRLESPNTIVTTGGKHALFITLQTLLNPGDEVLIISPYWVSYPTMVELLGGKVSFLDTTEENNWKINIDTLEENLKQNKKVLVLNNASNPTGVLYTKKELEEILVLCKKYDTVLLSDEVYSTLVFDNETFSSVAEVDSELDHSIIVHSASKMFGLTGLRVGFLSGNIEFIKKATNIQGQTTSGTSSISQYVVNEVFENKIDRIDYIKSEMEKRRNVLYDELSKKGTFLKPQSAIYGFINIKEYSGKDMNSLDFADYMLTEKRIAVVPGIAFGKKGYFRVSFGVEEEKIRVLI